MSVCGNSSRASVVEMVRRATPQAYGCLVIQHTGKNPGSTPGARL